MALLQPGGNDGQAMGALSFGSGPDASLAASTPARGAGCWPGPAQLVAAALAPEGPNNLMPLSSGGLWLAETIKPPAAWN